MFSVTHIIYLAIFIPLAVGLAIFVGKKWGWHKRVLYVCCGLAVVSELVKIFSLVSRYYGEEGVSYYLMQEYLPFNLCSIQIIFIFMITFMKSENVKKYLMYFMYPTMLGGGLMALLIPTTSVNHGFFAPISFQFWIFHGMLIFLALYMIITKPVKFSIKGYFIALLMTAVAFVFAIYINSALRSIDSEVNFFFVARPPLEGLPILNLDHGWIVYILHLAWLAILLISLAYLPVFIKAIRDKLDKRRAKALTCEHDKNI